MIELLQQYGPMGLLLALIGWGVLNLEKVELALGRVLGLFGWIHQSIKRKSIISTIQGQINTFARDLDKEANGTMPYNLRLEFVKEMERAELLQDKNVVVVRIRNETRNDKNLAGC